MKNSMKSIIVKTMLLLFINMANISFLSAQTKKNQVSVTPFKLLSGKMNIRYERNLKSNFSLILDAQPMLANWYSESTFMTKTVRKGKAQGLRLSLELRKYFTPDGKITQYYYGGGIFSGRHNVLTSTKTSDSYFFGAGENGSSDLILVSSGAYLTGGLRKQIKSFFIDFSLNTGYNFTNHSKENEDLEGHFKLRTFHGLLIEPKLTIGIPF